MYSLNGIPLKKTIFERTDGQTDTRTNGQTNGRTDGRSDYIMPKILFGGININLQEPQRNRNATANVVNLTMTSTVYRTISQVYHLITRTCCR